MGSGRKAVNIVSLFVLNVLLFASIFTPFQANAGMFSFISNLLNPSSTLANGSPVNSQNIALLQATVSPAPAGQLAGDIQIVGGTSLFSEGGSTQSSDVKDHTVADDQISLYVVREGDSLPAIAKMFGVTANTIVWANNLTSKTVKVGQKLVILPISGVEHTVKSGDTLQSIAKLHKADLDDILQYNNLTASSKLAIGDVIIVPDGEVTTISPTPRSTSTSSGQTSGSPSYSGYYMRPVIGGIKTQGIHGHNGVDLASSEGSNILAAASGTVIISRNSGWNGGYGSYIVVSHPNGTQTLYAHLNATKVSEGDEVAQGQVIGFMGHTGQVVGHPGTHLHFEVRGAKNPF